MPSAKLLDVAQSIMDAYYQDFRSDDAFFDLPDFANWLGRVYGSVADDVAKEIYANSLVETGMGQLTFSQDWWQSEDFDVKRKDGEVYLDLDIKYLGFTYDTQNSGIQLVQPIGNNCGNFIRTTLTELWQLNHVTTSNITWWYPSGKNKILLKTTSNVKRARVYYIPTVDDKNFELPSSKEYQIAVTSWQFMMQAKTGTPFVDQTNDSNKNITPQTEINQANLKPLGK